MGKLSKKRNIKDSQNVNAPQAKLKLWKKYEYECLDIWVGGTLNQLFITDVYAEIEFSKKWSG